MNKPKLPSTVYALGATSLLNDAASDMVYPLLPLFLASAMGAGAASLGLIEGAAEAMASFLRLFSGQLSDRVRRRKPFVVVGYLLASAARPLIAFAGSVGTVLAIRLTDRFGKGLRSSPRDALIADVVPPTSRARAFGVHEAMDHAGAVVGPLLAAGLLALGFSLKSVFLASAIPAAVACLLVILLVREAPRAQAPTTAAPRVRAPHGRPFLGYLAAVTAFSLGNAADAFLILRAHDVGIPVTVTPILWAVHNGVRAVTTSWGGHLADRLGRRRTLALGWAVYALIYGAFAVVTGPLGIVTLFVLYGFYFAFVGGAQKALVADLVPPEARASGYGLYHLCLGLALLPASALFGWLYQRVSPAAAFGTSAAFSALGIVLLPLSRVPVRRPMPAA